MTTPNNGLYEAKLADVARNRQARIAARALTQGSSIGQFEYAKLLLGSLGVNLREKLVPVNKKVQAMAGETLTAGAVLAAGGVTFESNALVASALGALGLQRVVAACKKFDALSEGEWTAQKGSTWTNYSLIGASVGALSAGGVGIKALEVAHQSGLKAAIPAAAFAAASGLWSLRSAANVPAHAGQPVASRAPIGR